MQKSWVKLSRSLRNRTKSSRRIKLQSQIPSSRGSAPRNTTRRLVSKATMRLTVGEEAEAAATGASIVGEEAEAVEHPMERANRTIAGEDTTTDKTTVKSMRAVVS